MQILLVTLLAASALSAPAPQLSQDGNTRLVPLLIRDPDGSPNTLVPVVVPAPSGTQENIEETEQFVENVASQGASGLLDADQAVKTENIDEGTVKETSEPAVVEEAVVEEVLTSADPEVVVQAETTVSGGEASETQLAEDASSAKATEAITDIASAGEAEQQTIPLPDAMSNVMAMVLQAAVENADQQIAAAPEAQEDLVVVELAPETAITESEQVDSTIGSEAEVAQPETEQEVILTESGSEANTQNDNADAPGANLAEVVDEVAVVDEGASQAPEAVLLDDIVSGNTEDAGAIQAQVTEVVDEVPEEEVLPVTLEEEQQISTVDDTIAEAEATLAQAEEVLSGVVDVTVAKKESDNNAEESVSQSRGKSLSSQAGEATADTGSEVTPEVTAVEGEVAIDAATRSAIEAALTGRTSNTAAIVIFPQATAEEESQTNTDVLIEEEVTPQTELPALSETSATESEIVLEAVATIPVEVTTNVVAATDDALVASAAPEEEKILDQSASQTATVESSQGAAEINQPSLKQRPTPAQGNLLVNPATKSAFFSTSSFGSPISAANIILGQPVRIPGTFGVSSGITPQLQGSSTVQARNLVDPQFRQFIFDNDSPDVVAAKINFFRVRAATLGAPIAISVGPTPGSSSTAAPSSVDAAEASVSAPEVAPSDGLEVTEEISTAQETAPSTVDEVVELSTAVPSEAA